MDWWSNILDRLGEKIKKDDVKCSDLVGLAASSYFSQASSPIKAKIGTRALLIHIHVTVAWEMEGASGHGQPVQAQVLRVPGNLL